ncbi:MAG TPA: methyltransferase domain-containing protein [Solirubrobacteraceae bacterium]|nr:methyltransferase domain-containing protein [Solirubrobacteraceae bacterium]
MSATAAAAAERARPLLAAEHRDAPLHSGVIDLIADDGFATTGGAQRLMFTDVVPAIYERWWRPGLGRLLKGAFGPDMADERRIARLLLGLIPGDGVLDVACGPGNFTRDFARVVGSTGLAVGIDASPSMLARAVRDTPGADHDNVAYVRGDAVALPFRDQSFDAVCCFAAIHMFADPFAALDHMTRVLTPGGRIALFTSARGRTLPLRAWDGFVGERLTGQRMFEHDEVTGALRERGYVDVQQLTTGITQFVGGRKAQ